MCHANPTRTDVRGPKHPGLVGAGLEAPKTLVEGGFCCSLCVRGEELGVGRVGRTGERGIAWRGHSARAVGAPPRGWSPRVRGGLWLSPSPRAVLSWIAHARLRVRSADPTCVRRASPRARARWGRAKLPMLQHSCSRVLCCGAAVAGAAVAGAAAAGSTKGVDLSIYPLRSIYLPP